MEKKTKDSSPRLVTRVAARAIDVMLLVAADLALGQVIGFGFDWLSVRMKRSGARFSQHGGQTVLTLRAALKSRRFDDLMDILGSSYKATVTKLAA